MVVHLNVIKLCCDFFRMDHDALFCHTTPTQNGPVCSLLSGWTTTKSKLLGPKMAFGVFLKGMRRATASGVDLGFATFRLLSRHSTN